VDLRAPDRTGISAADRAATIAALCDPSTTPDDLARPGHVFPLRAQEGGVLMRRGHTEAAVDLVRLAGVGVTGVLCEILQPDGSMARRPELEAFAQHHRLKIVTIADLVAYRRRIEPVRRIAETALPSRYGDFTAVAYEVENGDPDYLALVLGDVAGADDVLVRIHSQCLTGDALGSLRCDCGEQLELAFDLIQREGQGVVIYIPGHEGRGIGLGQKIRAYALQERGCDTVEANLALGFPADLRSYGVAAHILAELDVRSVRLMTNNPAKRQGLSAHGVRVAEQVSLQVTPRPQNRAYLATKRERFNHDLDLLEEAAPDNVVPFVLPPVPTRVSTPAAPDLWQFDLAGI
jgi:3,4-dihydroxy 2-butanone 4-phosphate synthase/GTP cyclohydrolase II